MAEDSELKRRRFLQATGAAALTASVAGCSNDGGDSTPTDGGDDATDTPESFSGLDAYPYSANETDVESAKQVMEEAGYGPDDMYELDWLQYTSPAWKEMANTIRSRLEAAHINMNISEATFAQLLSTTESGDHEAYTLGWVADYPAPQNFLQLVDPENTVYDAEGATPNGARLFWSEDANVDDSVTEYMTEQYDVIQNNPGNSDAEQQARADAVPKIEQGIWESAALIPIYSSLTQLFWYDHLDYNPPGGMGPSRAKSNISIQGLEGKSRYDGTSGTFNTLDPIASGDTVSGGKVMNLFDAPLNYHNGTTEVRNLLIESYETNDDLTEYTFKLKEGMQFHGDYGEVTAADMVYSIRRLVESGNSTNTYFTNSVLDIARETDDDGNIVPNSTGVEQDGEYTFTITLNGAFGYTLDVLAYSAFSVVPEGIVGDIEGYEGDMSYEEFSINNPVGNGPFVFGEWNSGNGGNYSADRFDDYHGEVAAIEGTDSAILTESSAIYNRFVNENVDAGGIPTSNYDPSLANITEQDGAQGLGEYGPIPENDTTVNMSETPDLNTYYVGFNLEEVPTPVRKAMAYVVNHEQFVSEVFKGRGSPAYHLTPSTIWPGGGEAYRNHWQGN